MKPRVYKMHGWWWVSCGHFTCMQLFCTLEYAREPLHGCVR